MTEGLKILTAKILFWLGYWYYRIFNTTPWLSYQSLRKLFYTTNGTFNQRISDKISKEYPIYDTLESHGILGNLNRAACQEIADKIQQDGFYIFDKKLDSDMVDKLVELSLNTNAIMIPAPPGQGPEPVKFNRLHPLTIKYQFQEEDLIQNHLIQRLVVDKSILSMAQVFLNSKPILDQISMWWSTSISKSASSEVAQLYHFDMERIKFLKFFFYLTDVNSETGPHCYARGSNNGFPANLRKDGRIADAPLKRSHTKNVLLTDVSNVAVILSIKKPESQSNESA